MADRCDTRATDAGVGWTLEELGPGSVSPPILELLIGLRPTTHELHRYLAASIADGARYLVVVDRRRRPVALAGWRTLTTSRGRILYVDDLITDPCYRGQGAGSYLLDHLEATAIAEGFDLLELDSGVTREQAHGFYFRSGMTISAFHFSKQLDSTAPAH